MLAACNRREYDVVLAACNRRRRKQDQALAAFDERECGEAYACGLNKARV